MQAKQIAIAGEGGGSIRETNGGEAMELNGEMSHTFVIASQ